jgi:ferredoxin
MLSTDKGVHMKIVVDLNRCRSYGQCVFAAPNVFCFHGEQSLEYNYHPDEELRLQGERTAAACPVQAISIGQADHQKSSERVLMNGKYFNATASHWWRLYRLVSIYKETRSPLVRSTYQFQRRQGYSRPWRTGHEH